MSKLNDGQIMFIGLIVEGFFYGFYSAIFAMYLQYQSKQDTNKQQNIVFYSICALYVLSVVLFVADTIMALPYQVISDLSISFIEIPLFGCCDFIAQFILIYRCWIVWGCNIRVVLIPSISALTFLVIWLVGGPNSSAQGPAYISSGDIATPTWGNSMILSGLALSLIINALVTGLIIFRIFKVFREVRVTLNDQILGTAGGSKLRRTILILIESGMALFSIQLVRVVVTMMETDAALSALWVISSIHSMLNGITPTIILVRTAMGLSFHDETSMEEFAIASLRFASDHPNSIQESIIISQDNGDDDIGVELPKDINIEDV